MKSPNVVCSWKWVEDRRRLGLLSASSCCNWLYMDKSWHHGGKSVSQKEMIVCHDYHKDIYIWGEERQFRLDANTAWNISFFMVVVLWSNRHCSSCILMHMWWPALLSPSGIIGLSLQGNLSDQFLFCRGKGTASWLCVRCLCHHGSCIELQPVSVALLLL